MSASADRRRPRSALSRLVSNGRFRRLWAAQLVSGVGDWFVIGLLIPMVTSLSGGSSFAVAGVLIAKIVPALVLSSLTGALVDRSDRRRTMIAADVARALLVLVLLFTNSLAAIYLVVLLMETASLFFWPARNALIPALVEERDVTEANGAMYTTQQAAMLIGLTASGAILAGFEALVRALIDADVPIVDAFVGLFAPALLGPRAGFALNAASFVFSATVLAGIRVEARPAVGARGLDLTLLGRDALDSFRFLRDHAELRGLLTTVFVAILGGGAIVPVGLDYISSLVRGELAIERVRWLSELAASPQTFMLVFLAAGMFAGALIVPRLERRVQPRALFTGSVAGFGLAMLGFASVDRYGLAALFACVAGGCIATLTVAGNSYVVRTTEDALRGRVFTALESLVRVSLLLSMVVVAPVNDMVGAALVRLVEQNGLAPERALIAGPRTTLTVSAGIVLAAAVYGFGALKERAARPAPQEGCDG